MNNKKTTRNNMLDQLIRRVGSSSVSHEKAVEKLIIVDQYGRGHEKKPQGFNPFATYKYYLVNHMQQIVYNGYLYTVHHDRTSIDLMLDLKVRCNIKDAPILAEKVFASENTPLNIFTLIQSEVELFDRRNVLSDNFYEKRHRVESQIKERLQDIGLTVLVLGLRIDGATEKKDTREINIAAFKVRLRDTIPQAKISLSGLIVIKKGLEAMALNKELAIDPVEEEIIRITRWCLQQYITPEDLYKNYNTAVKQRVEQELNEYLRKYGREIENLFIAISRNGTLEAITIESNGSINIRLNNSHQPLMLSYRCELLADPAAHERVLLFPANNIEIAEILLDQVKTTLSRDVNLEEFDRSLNTVVSSRLAQAINMRISSWGRIVGYMHLDTVTKLPPPDVDVVHSVSCITQDGVSIKVANRIYFRKDYDAHKIFEAHQIPDIYSWGIKEIERIDKAFIINKTYNELKYRFHDGEIRDEMEKEAFKIGYKINQLVIIPEFEGSPLGDLFDVKYKNENLRSKVDGISLAISISIDGKINDFDKALKRLAPKESISDSISNTISAKMTQFFYSVDPNRFYLGFYNDLNDQGPLEAEIKEKIITMINNDYGAEIREITVNQMNTRLIKRLRELQEGTCYCEFHDATGRQHYKAMVAVLGIDPEGWFIFNARGYKPRSENYDIDVEREDIVQHIKEYLENLLNNVLIPNAGPDMAAQRADLSRKIYDEYNELYNQIREFFGLNIRIYRPVNIDMQANINFKKRLSTVKKMEEGIETNVHLFTLSTEERKKRLEELYLRRRKDDDGLLNDPVLVQINEEIKALEADEYDYYASLELEDTLLDEDSDENNTSEDLANTEDKPE